MMKKVLCLATLVASATNASTTVAVLEFGKKGSVRRTTSNTLITSVTGIQSLWRAMSNEGPQHAGMTVVPDLFQKPKNSIVIGISVVNLDSMPILSKFVGNESSNVVGHMNVPGLKSKILCLKTGNSNSTTAETILETIKLQIVTRKLSSVHIKTEPKKAAQIDVKVREMMTFFEEYAGESPLVVYLVVDEEASLVHLHLESRDLEDENNNGDKEAGNDGNKGEEDFQFCFYYDNYDNCVNPYKDMFEIQYFNVVLGTSLGLTFLVFYALWLTVNMSLMPDMLLFGESVKNTCE